MHHDKPKNNKTKQATKQGDNHSLRGVLHARENKTSLLETSKWSQIFLYPYKCPDFP